MSEETKHKLTPPPLNSPEARARVIWALYLRYGLGTFSNWVTLRNDSLERAEVVEALQCPDIRLGAQHTIAAYREKIAEIKSLLAEAERESNKVAFEETE